MLDHESIGLVLVLLLGGWGVKRALAAGRAERERHDELWSTAARRVRGELDVGKGSFFRTPVRRIVLRAGDARIVVETVTSSEIGGGKTTSTRVTAGPIEGLRDLDLRVTPRGMIALGRISKKLRLAEIATGNDAFDTQMRVQGSPAPLVREFLDARLSRDVLRLGEGFEIVDACVVIVREGLPEDAATIVSMVSFVETLAARWAALVEAPRSVGDALDLERVEGEPGVIARGIRRGREVTLSVRIEPSAVSTVVSFDAISGERVEVTRDGLAPDREELVRAVDAALEAARPAGAYR